MKFYFSVVLHVCLASDQGRTHEHGYLLMKKKIKKSQESMLYHLVNAYKIYINELIVLLKKM